MFHFSKNCRGFTIIELLVSITIMAVILTIIILNQSTYTDTAALSNLADEIGLTVSQAQAYGIGVKEFSTGSSNFNASYGLTFSLLGSGSNKAYLSFADRDGNSIYSGNWSCPFGGTSECLEKFNISRGNYINSLCIVRTSGADLCDVGRVDIIFVRPSTEAKIFFFNNGGQQYSPANIKGAKIDLKSPRGSMRSVIVYQTGQVSVSSGGSSQNPPLPPPPPPSSFTLIATKSGTGTGTVTGNGINCGVTCNVSLLENTVVALTATPASGSAFSGWSGSCAGTGTCNLTMNGNKTVNAGFVSTYVSTQVTGCSSMTANQMCIANGFSSASAANGYWWYQCAGPTLISCSGLSCSFNSLDCVGQAWGGQIKTGGGGTVYTPQSDFGGFPCGGWNAGYRMRLQCVP